MEDIDDVIADVDEEEGIRRASASSRRENSFETLDSLMESESSNSAKIENGDKGGKDEEMVLIGKVEKFFSKLGVAAITLSGKLSIGDTIEISDDSGSMRFEVSSMQIDRKDVETALKGDDVGIKVNGRVSPGSSVYVVRPEPSFDA